MILDRTDDEVGLTLPSSSTRQCKSSSVSVLSDRSSRNIRLYGSDTGGDGVIRSCVSNIILIGLLFLFYHSVLYCSTSFDCTCLASTTWTILTYTFIEIISWTSVAKPLVVLLNHWSPGHRYLVWSLAHSQARPTAHLQQTLNLVHRNERN